MICWQNVDWLKLDALYIELANYIDINDMQFNGVDFFPLFLLDLLNSNALQYSSLYYGHFFTLFLVCCIFICSLLLRQQQQSILLLRFY